MNLSHEHCWAKTDPITLLPALSIRDHCLNVGCVGEWVVDDLPRHLVSLLPSNQVILIAVHDIGKYSPGFLMKCPSWRSQWQSLLKLHMPEIYEGNHALAGQTFLEDRLGRMKTWSQAIGGHHGVYKTQLKKPITPGWQTQMQSELLRELEATWGSVAQQESVSKGPRLHWFCGLIIFCDWIGSNTRWFPLNCSATNLTEARRRASVSRDEIGWHRRQVRPGLSFSELFVSRTKGELKPRPLQTALLEMVDGPGLYVVEAPMGEGKTEAALAAAYRRWTQGDERGLYFGLPTQLTSNRIHSRVEDFLKNVVLDESTLALVHGNAWISDHQMTALDPANQGEESSTDLANLWFAGSRKPLLAPFGVGTIDQALMSVLPIKFSALRLFALSGKVVIFDEIHSYDPYTSTFVDLCVEWLLEVGCTVIILSATLTKARRATLVNAARGLETNPSSAYPLITKVSKGLTETVSIPNHQSVQKNVQLECCDSAGRPWIETVERAVEAGACVMVIRNTIAAAQSTFRLLREQCREGTIVGLLHSRFTQHDRQRNEEYWIDLLGPDTANRPEGCVLVGTQVLEQSLDIDSDFMVTDLAPTELILQRMGRLHRHLRSRPEGYTKPQCVILYPNVDWTNPDGKVLKKQLGSSSYIYPAFTLYQSHNIWSTRSEITLPDEVRYCLEKSASIPPQLPPGAEVLLKELDNLKKSQLRTATHQKIFDSVILDDDEEDVKTRWNSKPTGWIVLLESPPKFCGSDIELTFRGGLKITFTPIRFCFELARALNLYSVRVPLYYIKNLLDKEYPWLYQHMRSSVFAICPTDSQDCHPLTNSQKAAYQFTYSSEFGLMATRIFKVALEEAPEDESWF